LFHIEQKNKILILLDAEYTEIRKKERIEMKIIKKKFISNDEEILWEHSEEKDLLKEIIVHLIIGIFLMIFLITVIIIISRTLEWLSWYVVLLLSVIPILLFVRTILVAKKDYSDKLNKLQISRKELRNYENVYILTNKRWIQKDYDLNFNIDISKYTKGALERKKDIVFVNLEKIQVIYTVEDKKYMIAFYIDYDEENLEETYLGVWLSPEEFKKVMKILKKVIPIEKEKLDKFGATVYFRKQK